MSHMKSGQGSRMDKAERIAWFSKLLPSFSPGNASLFTHAQLGRAAGHKTASSGLLAFGNISIREGWNFLRNWGTWKMVLEFKKEQLWNTLIFDELRLMKFCDIFCILWPHVFGIVLEVKYFTVWFKNLNRRIIDVYNSNWIIYGIPPPF